MKVPFHFFFLLKTRAHVGQAAFELTMWLRALCLHLPGVGTSVAPHSVCAVLEIEHRVVCLLDQQATNSTATPGSLSSDCIRRRKFSFLEGLCAPSKARSRINKF